ncbi:hypothetical protein ACEPAH_5896 [Sanghuangporus vaninii]
MPSVRLRRSRYASLSDDDGFLSESQRRPRSRTLASIYRPSSQAAPQAPAGLHSRPGSSPSVQEQATISRPSSVRPTGRVAENILYGAPDQNLGEGTNLSRGSSQGDVLSSSSESEGRKRYGRAAQDWPHAALSQPDGSRRRTMNYSTLSLYSDTSDDSFDPYRNAADHEEDIVEHLDVIDPEIATVASLTNAANSILIPPIGVYSRKPVVFLPRTAITDGVERMSIHEDELDRHVEHVLSKRDKVRRILRGVWAFVKTPLGIVTAIYGFLVVFWGAAIVLFLLKWIDLNNSVQQGFWVEVTSQIENALFTVTGIGLIPWRIVDTYRILRIWHYKKLTRKLRKKANLPELFDEDDLPDPIYDPNYVHVLTEKQERDLHHQQRQFAKSQTWYRAHGTPTHRAFPIGTALAICCCNDGNSICQIVLCGTMWGLDRFDRPAWSTGLLIPAAFLCGIAAAVLIWRGGAKTKRTKEIEEKLRLALRIELNPDRFKAVEAKNNGAGGPEGETPVADGGLQADPLKIPDYEGDQAALRRRIEPTDDRISSILVDEKMEVPRSYGLR